MQDENLKCQPPCRHCGKGLYFTSQEIDTDESPWLDPVSGIRSDCQETDDFVHAPRSTSSNNPNPVLVGFRKMTTGRDPKWLGYAARLELTWLDRGYGSLQAEATPEQVEHARRVLQRIAGTHAVSHRVPV